MDGCNLGLFLPWDCILIQAMCGKLTIQWAVGQTLLHAEKAVCCSGSICSERQAVPSFIYNCPYCSWPSTGKKQEAFSQCYWPQKEAVGSPFLHRQLSDAEDEHLDFQHRSQGFLTEKSDHHRSHRLQSGPGIYNAYRYSSFWEEEVGRTHLTKLGWNCWTTDWQKMPKVTSQGDPRHQ